MATFIALRALNRSSNLRVPAVSVVDAPSNLAASVAGTDGTFGAGGTFYYVVTAVGDGGETPVSNEVSAVVPARANEVQSLDLHGASGGTYKLTFDGQETAAINWNDDSTTIQAALVALSNVASGDITVTGTGPFTLTFGGAYAYTNVSQITVSNDSTTGGTGVAVTTTTPGQAANHVALDWDDDTGADSYRIYRGTGTGTEDHYQTSATSSFTDLGATGTAGTPPSGDTASTTLGQVRLRVDQDTVVNVDDVKVRKALCEHRAIGQYIVTAWNASTATATPPANS